MLKSYLHKLNLKHYIKPKLGLIDFKRQDYYIKPKLGLSNLQRQERILISNIIKDFNDSYKNLSGAEIFNNTLSKLNVKTVFGYPGGAVLPIFDAIYKNDKFKFILTKHEQNAGHMAQGYARVTKEPGIVIVTSGPGATNIITPLQDALMDGTPLIVFAGQVATNLIGTDAFQEANIIDISKPCTKWNYSITKTEEIESIMKKAYDISISGRPGPVLIEIPKDISVNVIKHNMNSCVFNYDYNNLNIFKYSDYIIKDTDESLQHIDYKTAHLELINKINNAKKPVIYAGQGSLDAYKEVREFAIKSNIPVTTTLQGLGTFDETHKLSLRMLGMHGSVYANKAMQEADVIISIGARFDDRATGVISKFAPVARKNNGIIQFEIEPTQIGKTILPSISVIGDAKINLQKLLPYINRNSRIDWNNKILEWKIQYPFTFNNDKKSKILKQQLVLQKFNKQTNNLNNVIITTGVGVHQMLTCRHLNWNKPNTMITSGSLGTMGFGLPAAIGVKLAKPNSMVVDIDGDGSFCMTLQEMKTASTYNINVKVLLLNNELLGMVSQWQNEFYNQRHSHTDLDNPDFKLLAKSMGWKYIKCTNKKSLSKKMNEFIKYNDGPILAEFVVDKNEKCLPMVKPGGSLDDMILE